LGRAPQEPRRARGVQDQFDFGWRAIHEMTLKAKAIIQAFYGDAPKKSFFPAASLDGGRQA